MNTNVVARAVPPTRRSVVKAAQRIRDSPLDSGLYSAITNERSGRQRQRRYVLSSLGQRPRDSIVTANKRCI